jgi:NADH-quinone oxidoreductase subunit G
MRIRKNYLKRKLPVFSIGQIPEQTYPVEILGKRLNVLESIYTGSSGFVQNITKAHHPMLIVGSNILTRPDGKAILAYIHKIAKKYNLVRDDWNGINILHKSASIVAGLDLGIVPGREGLTTSQQLDAARKGKLSILYLLGVDEINIEKTRDCFVIYQGHHGDRGASIADIIFPGAAYSEKNATYVNLEGRPQTTKRVVPPPGAAMEDWATITEFANNIGITIPYNSVEELREDLYYLKPHFAKIGEIAEYGEWEFYEDPGHVDIDIDQQVANAEYTNYYQINPIMRSSATLIKRHNDFNPNVKAN